MDLGVTGKLGGYYLAEQAAKKKAWELPRKHGCTGRPGPAARYRTFQCKTGGGEIEGKGVQLDLTK